MSTDKTNSDGPPAPADSPTSPPTTSQLPVPTKSLGQRLKLAAQDIDDPNISEQERERRIFAENLRLMGLNRKTIRKLFVGQRGTDAYLRRKVAGRVQIVGFISTADQLEKAIRVLTRLVAAKNSEPEVKIAAAECLAQVSTAKLRLGEAIIEHADKCDPDADALPPPPKEVKSPVEVNFNFPPVAPQPKQADVEITDAKSG